MAEVFVLGSGGREEAIAAAVGASPEVSRVEVNPSVRDGLELFAGSTIRPFVIIGPEARLVDGTSDDLRADGHTVFGVSRQAAGYEASKAKTVDLAVKYGIRHPSTYIARGSTMKAGALSFVKSNDPKKFVVKPDGLTAGKGVLSPESGSEAEAYVNRLLNGAYSGAGTSAILFAERKHGPEVSVTVVVGKGKDDFVILPFSQDHKRLKDNDEGVNTGGMGAYTPLPKSIVSDAQSIKIHNKVYNLLDAMKREGVYYQGGVMYVGEMMSDDLQDDESDMLEINVRFGNPESQAILPSLTRAGVDVYRLLRSAAEHDLEKPSVDIAHLTGHAAVTVVLAAPGYPDDVKTGQIIHGLDKNYPNVQVTHAAVGKNDQGELITAGGRTIDVTGMGENVQLAARAAYAAIGEDAIHFEGNQFRRDIAKQALTWTAEFRG